jgi:hypothetical protein
MRDLHCWEWQQSRMSAVFSLSHTHGHKNMLLDTQVCFSVPPVYTQFTSLEWSENNSNTFTSLTFSSVKLSWLCPTIKGSNSLETLFKSVSCKIFGQCVTICEYLSCQAKLWQLIIFTRVRPCVRACVRASRTCFSETARDIWMKLGRWVEGNIWINFPFWYAVDCERWYYVSAHWICLSAVLPGKHTLLSAPRATRKGWVGAIHIPKFIILFIKRLTCIC